MNLKLRFWKHPLMIILLVITVAGCKSIDLYEKVVPIPDFEWHSSYRPAFNFTITDTTVPYQVYIVLRHTNQYNWNNIWVHLYTQLPQDSTGAVGDTLQRVHTTGPADSIVQKVQYELPLANKERWLGSAMGDVYEHRILITPKPVYFQRAGTYRYILEHAMREDPLLHVLNVGLRIEKKSD